MNRGNRLDQADWRHVLNVDATPAPPFAVMESVGRDDDTGFFKVQRPTANSLTEVFVNGVSPIAPGEVGEATRTEPATALIETAGGEPATGDDYGTSSGSWKLSKSTEDEPRSGFRVIGPGDDDNTAEMTFFGPGGPAGVTVRKNSGSNVGTQPRLNLIEGSGVTLTVSNDTTDHEIDVTIASSATSWGYTSDGVPGVISAPGTAYTPQVLGDGQKGAHDLFTKSLAIGVNLTDAQALAGTGVDPGAGVPTIAMQVRPGSTDAVYLSSGTIVGPGAVVSSLFTINQYYLGALDNYLEFSRFGLHIGTGPITTGSASTSGNYISIDALSGITVTTGGLVFYGGILIGGTVSVSLADISDLSSTRASGGRPEINVGTNRWVAFSLGSF